MKNLSSTHTGLTASANHLPGLLTAGCIIGLLLLLGSCKPSCTCAKNVGCKTLTAIKLNGDTLDTQTYCSQINYFADQALTDSVAAFRNRYRVEGVTIITVDTIGNYEAVTIDYKDRQYYLSNGYGCTAKF